MAGIGRDTGISRDTVRNYFSILEDTLLGGWLPAYKANAKIKEVATPKFYWFDSGVLHTAAGGFRQLLPESWKGILMEHWILHEIRAFMKYHSVKGDLGYWGTPSSAEIDFLHWYGKSITAIEVKASTRFRSEHLKGIRAFSEAKPLKRSFVIYLGKEEMKVGNTMILPAMNFLKRLYQGKVLDK